MADLITEGRVAERYRDMGDGTWCRVITFAAGGAGDTLDRLAPDGIVRRYKAMGDGTYAEIKAAG